MLRKVTLLLSLLAICLTINASAQDAQRITFDDAVQIALEQNVNLKRSANNLEFSEIDMHRARSTYPTSGH